jgi:hypothetical protein
MTPTQSLALTVHRNSAHGRTPTRDSDLTRLLEHWPDLQDVFEGLQFLRCRVEDLEDEVEVQTRTVSDLMDELHREV